MTSRLDYWRERLFTSIWPVPIALCLLYGALALVMLWLDRYLMANPLLSPSFSLDLESARQVTAIIAGSTIGVAGVAFSITMVAMTLTSAQYGPKVLRNFLEDRTSKLTLGQFLGTYVYALIALTGFEPGDIPRFTPLVALMLALTALIGFVQFIHRIATDLQADQIVQQIGRRMRDVLRDYAADRAPRSSDTLPWRQQARRRQAYSIASTHRGYIQTIDYAGLTLWCVANDCQLKLHARAGDFLVERICLCKVYCEDPQSLGDVVDQLNGYVVVGPVRTPIQDAEYPITQLNQLAGRALSPGINDPGTAITCIDWFSLALSEIIDNDLPGCVYLDDDGKARLLVRMTLIDGIVKAIYAPLRQLADADVSVTISLLESLCRLAELTRRPSRLALLRQHGDLILDHVDRGDSVDFDLRDIRQRHRKLVGLTDLAD